MDESTLNALEDPATAYRCPGETYSISHAVHVARLAAYYPACRNCEHRHDTGVLSQRHVRRIAEVERQAGLGSLLTEEGIAGVVGNQLSASDAHRFAAAFGLSLLAERRLLEREPSVILAGDGRALTAELVAAAGEGLRITGCRVIELGGATAGLLAWAVRHLNAAGGLLVGNERGEPHTASVKLWGSGARPWSAGDSLDRVLELFQQPFDRPGRRFGALERFSGEDPYLAELRELYHGLRPLRFVLDTSSRPLLGHLEQLLKTSACQIVAPRISETPKSQHALSTGNPLRVANLSAQVRADGADFGLWIDGDGQSLHVLDERGRLVPYQRLLFTLLKNLVSSEQGSRVVIEQDASADIERIMIDSNVKVIRSSASREAMHAALEANGAALGGGPSGRFWCNASAPQADALLTVSILLAILSQSDRPLSAVLDGNDLREYKKG